MKRKVWVVEMQNDSTGVFEPCASALLTKADAVREMKFYWKYNNPCDHFRVVKYVSSNDIGQILL